MVCTVLGIVFSNGSSLNYTLIHLQVRKVYGFLVLNPVLGMLKYRSEMDFLSVGFQSSP